MRWSKFLLLGDGSIFLSCSLVWLKNKRQNTTKKNNETENQNKCYTKKYTSFIFHWLGMQREANKFCIYVHHHYTFSLIAQRFFILPVFLGKLNFTWISIFFLHIFVQFLGEIQVKPQEISCSSSFQSLPYLPPIKKLFISPSPFFDPPLLSCIEHCTRQRNSF